MGLLSRIRRALQVEPAPQGGDPQADLATVRAALEAEAVRLQRRSRLSLTMLMEFAEADMTQIDLHAALGHLQSRGEIRNVRDDSFGNLRFDLGEAPLVD